MEKLIVNQINNIELVEIPAGSSLMGSEEGYADEAPQHEVTIQSFFMGRYPITQAQWRAVVSLPKIERELNPNPSHFKGDYRPVEQVSWHDVIEFCARLSQYTGRLYRLPTEAEWEYACRAGTTTPYSFGDVIRPKTARFLSKETSEVGSFTTNPFGLCDMHDNVWEWCQDSWHANYKGAPTDGRAWVVGGGTSRVVRGGSWDFNPWCCRSACRDYFNPTDHYYKIGFRVCCSTLGGGL